MKLKELKDTNLGGIKVKTPKGVVGYWKSQYYAQGVWLSDGISTRIYPQFVNSLKDCLEWEITEEEVNCNILTGLEYIDNTK